MVHHLGEIRPRKTAMCTSGTCRLPDDGREPSLLEDQSGIIEGSLEVKLPTTWTVAKAEVGRVRVEKKRSEKIREEKEREARRCRCAKR